MKLLYTTWCSMKQRCYYVKHKSYKYYGERGISICEEWKNNYDSFYKWAVANGWQKGFQIDRINVDGNYSPENCRIVNVKTNARNRRNTPFITFNGQTKSMIEWCEEIGLTLQAFRARIKYGWTIEQIFQTPLEKGFITYNGETKRISEWSKSTGIKQTTICMRLYKYGWSVERALLTKKLIA